MHCFSSTDLHVTYSSDLVYIPLIFAGVSVCSLCAFAGGSSSRAARKPQNTKKRARRGKPSDDNEDSHEAVIPTKATHREKSAAAKQRVAMPMHKWKMPDWQNFVSRIPILLHRTPVGTTLSSGMSLK